MKEKQIIRMSDKGLIEFYENLIQSGKVKVPGSALTRLNELKERYKQRKNKYYKLKEKWENR